MSKIRVIPVILLKNNNVVQSTNFSTHKIVGDPVVIIDRLSSWNADEIIYLNISRDRNYKINRVDLKSKFNDNFNSIIKTMSKHCFMPLTVGGGIKNINHAENLFEVGADKICINSESIRNPKIIYECAKKFGSQAVVVSIDVKQNNNKWDVYINNGKEFVNISLKQHIVQMQENGAGEILINSIDRDGSYNGYDQKLIKYVLKYSKVPLIALGGVGKWEHMYECVKKNQISALGASNIFHHTENSYYNAINYLNKKKINVRKPKFTNLKIIKAL